MSRNKGHQAQTGDQAEHRGFTQAGDSRRHSVLQCLLSMGIMLGKSVWQPVRVSVCLSLSSVLRDSTESGVTVQVFRMPLRSCMQRLVWSSQEPSGSGALGHVPSGQSGSRFPGRALMPCSVAWAFPAREPRVLPLSREGLRF